MTVRQLLADTDPRRAIPCRRTHQARTISVPTVPPRISMRDTGALVRFAQRRCLPQLDRVLGGTARSRRLSAYESAAFFPTGRQVRSGARWVRCDLVLRGGPRLASLPPAGSPQLGRTPHPAAVARCSLGRRKGYQVTTCSRPHAFRAAGTYRMSAQRYPGERARAREALRECGRIVGRDWLVSYALPPEFRLGRRLAVCSAPE